MENTQGAIMIFNNEPLLTYLHDEELMEILMLDYKF